MLIAFLVFLIVAVIYISLILPRLIDRADMSSLFTNYAHRGLYNNEDFPENSLGAFQSAVDNRYGIELDIQLSSDNIPMVFHDATLNRMCGVDGKLCDYTCAELQQMKLLGTDYTIPSLEEVLELVNGNVPLLVEFKPGNFELCDIACPMLDEYNGIFCVESFDPFIIQKIKKMRPQYARGQLITNHAKKKSLKNSLINFSLSAMLVNVFSRPDFVAYDISIKHNLSIFLCKHLFKIPLFAWTVDSEEAYKKHYSKNVFTIFERIKP